MPDCEIVFLSLAGKAPLRMLSGLLHLQWDQMARETLRSPRCLRECSLEGLEASATEQSKQQRGLGKLSPPKLGKPFPLPR